MVVATAFLKPQKEVFFDASGTKWDQDPIEPTLDPGKNDRGLAVVLVSEGKQFEYRSSANR